MISLQNVQDAIRQIETIGIIGYQTARQLIGEEMAISILVFHARRMLNSSLPIKQSVPETVKHFLNQRIITHDFANSDTIKYIQSAIEKIELNKTYNYYHECDAAEKDIMLALLTYHTRMEVRTREAMMISPEKVDEAVYSILVDKKIIPADSIGDLLKEFSINSEGIREAKKKQDQIIQDLDKIVNPIIAVFNNDESNDFIIRTFGIAISSENGLISVELNNLIYRKDGSYVYKENLDEKETLPIEQKMQSLVDKYFGVGKIKCFVDPSYYGK